MQFYLSKYHLIKTIGLIKTMDARGRKKSVEASCENEFTIWNLQQKFLYILTKKRRSRDFVLRAQGSHQNILSKNPERALIHALERSLWPE